MEQRRFVNLNKVLVQRGKSFSLNDYDTRYAGTELNKNEAEKLIEKGKDQLAEIQDKLYAHNQYSILIILQARDTAGKDSMIRHVMSGLNPAGVKVTSFKVPTSTELEHDYFWRHYRELPARGDIGIFNRSYYENVLVTRVHPEYILTEHIPGIDSLKDINESFWSRRLKQIKRFEKNLYQNGTIILKFYLHLSKEEQRKRLMERINDPQKNWKFSIKDLDERALWDEYQKAYEVALSATSTDYAPWFVIPADDKWYARLSLVEILYDQFTKLNLEYPEPDATLKAGLEDARKRLMSEP